MIKLIKLNCAAITAVLGGQTVEPVMESFVNDVLTFVPRDIYYIDEKNTVFKTVCTKNIGTLADIMKALKTKYNDFTYIIVDAPGCGSTDAVLAYLNDSQTDYQKDGDFLMAVKKIQEPVKQQSSEKVSARIYHEVNGEVLFDENADNQADIDRMILNYYTKLWGLDAGTFDNIAAAVMQIFGVR